MPKIKNHIILRYKRTHIQSVSKSKKGFFEQRGAKKWNAWILAVSFLFCFPFYSEAGSVYGRLVKDNMVLKNESFILSKDNVNYMQVKTDSNGYFNIMIPPGKYAVTYNEKNIYYDATLWSYQNEVRQDIHLIRRP